MSIGTQTADVPQLQQLTAEMPDHHIRSHGSGCSVSTGNRADGYAIARRLLSYAAAHSAYGDATVSVTPGEVILQFTRWL